MPRIQLRILFAVMLFCLFLILSVASPTLAQNVTIESFNEAKELAAKVFSGHEITFYCGCSYTGKDINLASCGYKPKKDANRAHRLEWEHVVPAHAFGQSFKEWREGHPDCVDSKGRGFKGRNCTIDFQEMFREASMPLCPLARASHSSGPSAP